jgi:hypothetical protein
MINPTQEEGNRPEMAAMYTEEHLEEMQPAEGQKLVEGKTLDLNGMLVAMTELQDPPQSHVPSMTQHGNVFKKGDLCVGINFIAIEDCWAHSVTECGPSVKTTQLF